MTIHMIVVHYPPGHIDVSRVLERLEDPIWKVIDILFLYSVLIHALAGLYAVLTDFQKLATYKKVMVIALIVVFLAFGAYGTITVLNFKVPAEMAAGL